MVSWPYDNKVPIQIKTNRQTTCRSCENHISVPNGSRVTAKQRQLILSSAAMRALFEETVEQQT